MTGHLNQSESMRNREIRIAIYSAIIGFITALILVQLYLSRTDARRKRVQERMRKQEEHIKALAEYQAEYQKQQPCTGNGELAKCPRCPDAAVQLPETLHKFVDEHMKSQRGSPLVIAKAQSKGLPSYYLSTHPREKDKETAHLLYGETGWQDKTLVRLCHLMNNAPPDAFFVDVGAYVGTIALGVASCGHKVAAIEPHPHNFGLLQESVALNKLDSDRILLYQTALGNLTGSTCMAASSSDHSNAKIPYMDPNNEMNCKNGKVPMARLDDVMKGSLVWILHIDVRGYEPAVLAGAEKILSQEIPPRYLMFSVYPGYGKQSLGLSISFADILDWLIRLGYSLKDSHRGPIKKGDEFLAQLGHDTDYVTATFEQQT